MANQKLENGQIIALHGYEFMVVDLRIETHEDGVRVYRFKGICTESKINDGIRRTGYNGGTYGWKV